MDIPAAAAPWLVLGLALGIALAVLVGLVVLLSRQPARRPAGNGGNERAPASARPSAGGHAQDDLPGFLESPPGSVPGAARPQEGWPALSAAPLPSTGALSRTSSAVTSTAATSTAGVLGAMALAALVLIAAAAAVAVSQEGMAQEAGSTRPGAEDDAGAPAAPQADRPSTAPAPSPDAGGAGDLADATVPPGDDGAAAELTFAGVVLERRAVGVTATYPVVDVTWDGDRAVAHVELPTFNCLLDRAPEDPVAAGCSRSVTEYADLADGDLEVRRDGKALVVTGAFPTYLRPNGTAPVWTGRRYELLVTAEPERKGRGWRPAVGVLGLGEDSARTTGTANRMRSGD